MGTARSRVVLAWRSLVSATGGKMTPHPRTRAKPRDSLSAAVDTWIQARRRGRC